MKDYALWYARAGWRVLPVAPLGKRPITPHGVHDATADPAQVEAWWSQTPDANVGIRTGGPDLLVLDVDPRNGGDESLRRLEQLVGDLSIAPRVDTGGGGTHLYFRFPESTSVRLAGKLAEYPGIDIKANGGYVVAPPSRHESGGMYCWSSGYEPWTRPPMPPPESLVRLLMCGSSGEGTSRGPSSRVKASMDLVEAAARYNADHQTAWPGKPGRCPACQHNNCFTALPANPGQWVCFSTDHTGPGRRADGHYLGDALDLAAYLAGHSPRDHLIAEGYLHDPRPTIAIREGEVDRMVSEAIAVLADDSSVFRRGSSLVIVSSDRPDALEETSASSILPLSSGRLNEKLCAGAKWLKYDGRTKGYSPKNPPMYIVNGILTRGEWPGVRDLAGVRDFPILRPDGTVFGAEGYDEETRNYHIASCRVAPIPTPADQSHARALADYVLEFVRDFPFEEPHSKSAWLAALLTTVGRTAFSGVAPLFLLDASVRGSGKTLLADCISIVLTGRSMPRSTFVQDDGEMRKQITAHLYAVHNVVLLDNLADGCRLASPVLAGLLTSELWSDRKLGETEQLTIPARATWFATGNNISISSDLGRRTLRIRLQPSSERPEERTEFRYRPLERVIRENRGHLLHACLTILSSFLRANPKPSLPPPTGSFEGWSNVVRAAVVWLGLPDPALALAARDVALDTDEALYAAAMMAWLQVVGPGQYIVLRDLVPRLESSAAAALKDALTDLCSIRDGSTPTAKTIGTRLGKVNARRFVVELQNVAVRAYFARSTARGGVAKWAVMIDPPTGQGQ